MLKLNSAKVKAKIADILIYFFIFLYIPPLISCDSSNDDEVITYPFYEGYTQDTFYIPNEEISAILNQYYLLYPSTINNEPLHIEYPVIGADYESMFYTDPATISTAISIASTVSGFFKKGSSQVTFLVAINKKLNAMKAQLDIMDGKIDALPHIIPRVRILDNLKYMIQNYNRYSMYIDGDTAKFIEDYRQIIQQKIEEIQEAINALGKARDPMAVNLVMSGVYANYYYRELLVSEDGRARQKADIEFFRKYIYETLYVGDNSIRAKIRKIRDDRRQLLHLVFYRGCYREVETRPRKKITISDVYYEVKVIFKPDKNLSKEDSLNQRYLYLLGLINKPFDLKQDYEINYDIIGHAGGGIKGSDCGCLDYRDNCFHNMAKHRKNELIDNRTELYAYLFTYQGGIEALNWIDKI